MPSQDADLRSGVGGFSPNLRGISPFWIPLHRNPIDDPRTARPLIIRPLIILTDICAPPNPLDALQERLPLIAHRMRGLEVRRLQRKLRMRLHRLNVIKLVRPRITMTQPIVDPLLADAARRQHCRAPRPMRLPLQPVRIPQRTIDQPLTPHRHRISRTAQLRGVGEQIIIEHRSLLPHRTARPVRRDPLERMPHTPLRQPHRLPNRPRRIALPPIPSDQLVTRLNRHHPNHRAQPPKTSKTPLAQPK